MGKKGRAFIKMKRTCFFFFFVSLFFCFFRMKLEWGVYGIQQTGGMECMKARGKGNEQM